MSEGGTRRSRGVGRAAFGLLVVLAGCAKSTDDWLADLSSEDPYARLMAVVALVDVPPADDQRFVVAMLTGRCDEDEGVRKRAWDGIVARRAELVPVVVDLIGAGALSDEQRGAAVTFLATATSAAVAPLIAALEADGVADPGAVARTLVELAPAATDALIERVTAAASSAPRGTERLVAALAEALARDPERLFGLLEADVAAVRRAVAGALPRVDADHPRSAELLVRGLAVFPDLRELVVPPLVDALLLRIATDEGARITAGQTLLGLGDVVVPHVVRALEDGTRRDWAAVTLLAWCDVDETAVLNELDLRYWLHRDLFVRIARKRGARSVPALVLLLGSDSPDERIIAADALGQVGGDARDAIAALERASRDPTPDVAEAALRALDAIRTASGAAETD